MKRGLIMIMAVLALLMGAAAAGLWMFDFDSHYILRDGGGGVGGGSEKATVILFWERGEAGVGWTHSDLWYEGTIQLPVWALVVLSATLSTVFFWLVWRGKRPAVSGRGFPVIIRKSV